MGLRFEIFTIRGMGRKKLEKRTKQIIGALKRKRFKFKISDVSTRAGLTRSNKVKILILPTVIMFKNNRIADRFFTPSEILKIKR